MAIEPLEDSWTYLYESFSRPAFTARSDIWTFYNPDLGTESWGFLLLLFNRLICMQLAPHAVSTQPPPTLALEWLVITLFSPVSAVFVSFAFLLWYPVDLVLEFIGTIAYSFFVTLPPLRCQRRCKRHYLPPYNYPIYSRLFYYMRITNKIRIDL